MCGILGSVPSSDYTPFKLSLDKLTHRGPDGYGIWTSEDKGVSLGHRRLSILDTSERGSQPMSYHHLNITFNGEIYNFIEIKKELEDKGYFFKTESDTEVILAAYLAWGTDCFKRFNGMWAMALYDRKTGQLLLSRDRFGKKPLFYAFYEGKFYFASEMKAITSFFSRVEVSPDFNWCYQNLKSYESSDKCLIKHISRFPAGCYAFLKFEEKRLEINPYWNTLDNLIEVPQTYEEQVEAFKALFIDACNIRMRSDVPVGTSLSGGLDSSAIVGTVAYITKNMRGDRVYSDWQSAVIAAFPGSSMDETDYALQVTDFVGIKPTIVNINNVSEPERFEKYVGMIEELTTTDPVPMVETYKAMRASGIIVTLDGHGADELLSGYHYGLYEAFYDCGFNFKIMKQIVNTRLETIPADKEFNDLRKGWLEMPYFFARNIGIDLIHRLKNLPAFGKIYRRPLPAKRYEKIEQLDGYFNTMLYHLFHDMSMPTHLRNYDRFSMINGVEIRMPFLDHRVVSFLMSTPWSSKIRNGFTKSILRDAVKDFIPHDVAFRKKKIGFGAPMLQVMRHEWKEYLLDSIHSKSFEQSITINSKDVKSQIIHLLHNENASFSDAQRAYQRFMPYVWEKTVINNHQTPINTPYKNIVNL